MKPPIYLEGVRPAVVRIAPTDLPLGIGGTASDLPLPGDHASEPAAHLGADGGEVFVEPRAGGEPVMCNGARLTTSRWLQPGDVLRVGASEITVGEEDGEDATRLRVRHLVADRATEPPVVVETQTIDDGGADAATVEALPFEPRQIGKARSRRHRGGASRLLVWALVACLAGVAGYVFTARSVEIEIVPAADEVSLDGALPPIEIGGRRLMHEGEYRLTATLAGHHPLDVTVAVTDAASQSYRFELAPLPGRLTIATLAGATISVDGAAVGAAPLAAVELAAGTYAVTVTADRYLEWSEAVTIEGKGREQTVEATLLPAWGDVTLASEPAGATVRVDDETVGVTPVTAEILAGRRRVELALAGYKRHRLVIDVTAGAPLAPPAARLEPADARVVVRSRPAGATVAIDDRFVGATPVDVDVDPGGAHSIEVSKAGYEPVARTVRLRSGEVREMTLTLAARLGEVEVIADPPDAEVFVDGAPRGRAGQVLSLAATAHVIEIRKEGYEPHRAELTPRPGLRQSVRVTLEPKAGTAAALAATPGLLATSQGQELRLIKPRRFTMGASRREPGRRANETLHDVDLTRPYFIATTEVSNRQYREFNSGHSSGRMGSQSLDQDDHPVVRVTWEDAARYCNWLSARESLAPAYIVEGQTITAAVPMTTGYRLPSEAEWARAARYPDGQHALRYPWGDSLPVATGNYADQSATKILARALPDYDDKFAATAPAGSFAANRLGLFNLGDNVAEWVHDYYAIRSVRRQAIERDPLGPSEGDYHVIRGASWMQSSVSELRLSYRDYGNEARPDLGFRIARYGE